MSNLRGDPLNQAAVRIRDQALLFIQEEGTDSPWTEDGRVTGTIRSATNGRIAMSLITETDLPADKRPFPYFPFRLLVSEQAPDVESLAPRLVIHWDSDGLVSIEKFDRGGWESLPPFTLQAQ